MRESNVVPDGQLVRYRCHKEVKAAKIIAISPRAADDTTLLTLEGVEVLLKMPIEWTVKHKPEVGGYYVLYQDGYVSYSPARPFEEGYTRV